MRLGAPVIQQGPPPAAVFTSSRPQNATPINLLPRGPPLTGSPLPFTLTPRNPGGYATPPPRTQARPPPSTPSPSFPSPSLRPPLPLDPVPQISEPVSDPATFECDPSPLSRLVSEMPTVPGQASFQATRLIDYDPNQHGPLQNVLDAIDAFALVRVRGGEYQLDINIQKAIYLQSSPDSPAAIVGTGASDTIVSSGSFVVLDGFTLWQSENTQHGAIAIKSGYASLMNCRIVSASASPVVVSNDASMDLYGCEICGSVSAGLLITDNSIARCAQSVIHQSQTYGVFAAQNGAVSLNGCRVYENGRSGIASVDAAHVWVAQTEVFANGGSGFDLASSGRLAIESASVHDHANGSGVLARGAAALSISETSIARSKFGAIRAFDGAVVQSKANSLQDAERAALLVAHKGGYVESTGDAFEGACVCAFASFARGSIVVAAPKLRALSGGGGLVYDGGRLAVTDAAINGGRFGIQSRNRAFLELTRVSVTEAVGPCLSASNEVHGFAEDSNFNGSQSIGVEMAAAGAFRFVRCGFAENAIAGALVHGASAPCFSECNFNQEIAVHCTGDGCAATFVGCAFKGTLSVANKASANLANGGFTAGEFGIAVTAARAVATGLDLSGCTTAAIAVFESGSIVIDGAKIHDCPGFAVQARTRGSVRLVNGTVVDHTGPATVLAVEDGIVQLEKCQLADGPKVQGEARESGVLHFDKCDIEGAGLQAVAGGKLQVVGGKVHGSEIGVMIGDGGVCKAMEWSAGAVYADTNAIGEFQKCVFDGTGEVAVQIQGGSVSLDECMIAGYEYGVFVHHSAKLIENGTRFERIERKEIYREQ